MTQRCGLRISVLGLDACGARHARRGFTLLEMLVATLVFAILASAIYGVFTGALRLRERAYASVEKELTATAATEVMRRDLNGLIVTSNTLAMPMQGAADRKSRESNDMLEFYTTAGVISDLDDEPWGDVERVRYTLEEPETRGKLEGLELVRRVWRNIYTENDTEPQVARLMGGVRSLRFEYLDQQAWVDEWDSSLNDDRPPQAVRVTLEFEPQRQDANNDNDRNRDRARPPLILMYSIAAQPKSDDDTTSSGTTSL